MLFSGDGDFALLVFEPNHQSS